MVDNPGKRVTEYNVAQLLNAAYEKAAKLKNAMSGFRSSGIVSFNPDVFSESDLAPALLTEINTKDASSMNMSLYQEALVNLEENAEISESITSNASANDIITSAAVFQVTNTSHTPNEAPSTSTHLNTFDLQHEELYSEVVTQVKSTLTFSQLSPFPNAQLVTRKRKSQQSQIITSSPFKKAIVNCKPTTSHTKQSLKYHKQQAPKKSQAYYCILCSEPYKDSPEEDWIQCLKCKKWCIENCSDFNRKGQFVSDFCLS